MAVTAYGSRAEVSEQVDIPVAESLQDLQLTPAWLDRWAPWLVGAVILILIAYGPQLIAQISNIALNAPGGRFW
jgi:hypothetical protein